MNFVWLYRQQLTVEQAFKYFKIPNLIQIRPIFHRKDDSIRGHLFACVIGLLLLTLLALKVHQQFPEFSLPSIVNILSEIGISLIKFSGSNKIIREKRSNYTDVYQSKT
jgi:transposase